ncbi:MAG: EAL domain-containing protein [Comamonadaceae bacterium]|nr:MAG: EAL domain-containing protein [Comamonadaceae bacterium]
MAHNLLLLGLLYVALIAALACVPTRQLIAPDRKARWLAGAVSGSITTLATWMLPLPELDTGLHLYPTMTVVCGFFFGPLAGAVSAVSAAVLVPWLHGTFPQWSIGLQALVLWGAASLWFLARTRLRVNVWLALLCMAFTPPLLVALWALIPALPLSPQLPAAWRELQAIPWRYALGALLLGGGIELVRSRARSLWELRLREEELQAAIDASGGGRWEWDVAAQRYSCHGSFYRAFGLQAGAGHGASDWQHWNARRHPDDLERIGAHLHRAMQGQENTYYAEFRMRDDQGRWRRLISRGQVVERDAAGRALRLVGMDLDITDHHDLQEALRASETKYTTVYHTLPDAAGIARLADGRFLDVNPAFTRLIGRSRDDVLGKTSLELGVWQSVQERAVLRDTLRLHGEVKNLHMTAHRDGADVPGLVSARIVRIADDDCMVFVFHDMTQEQQVRDELVSANRLLRQAGWLARLGVWEHHAEHGLVYWSDVCFDIHGLPQDAPLPRDYLRGFVAPAWRRKVVEQIRQALAQPCAWSMDIEIVRVDGRQVWVRVRGESIVENGAVTRVRGVMQDIDERTRADERLRRSEERFAGMFQLLPYPIGLSRRGDGRYVDVNPAWEQALGYTRQEAIDHSSVELGIYTQQAREQLVQHTLRHGQVVSYEMEMTTRSGDKRTVLQSMSQIDIHGEPCWLFAILDITDRQRAEQRVREREEQLSLTISAAALGLWDWNMQTGVVSGDARWRDTMGLPAEGDLHTDSPLWTSGLRPSYREAITTELARHSAHPETPFDATWQIGPQAADSRWVRSLGKIVTRDAQGRPQRMVGVTIDVTHQREQQELLQKMAHYDALTGLPNRVLLAQRLQECIDRATQQSHQLAVAYLDLDGFKPVNDRLGHGAGDRLLVTVAKRLLHALRPGDCVARLGGDEFVILLPELGSRAECEELLNTVMHSIAAPYPIDAERVIVTASIGYTLYPEDGADADALLRHADHAMYAAKQAGRNRFHAFDTAHERALQTQREYGAQVAQALRMEQFVLYLQPKVDMRLGTVVGAEALARWQHPERGLLAPGAFLPLIDHSELEVPFGEWVVEAALVLIGRLQSQGLALPISVNISALHLQQQGFADWMTACLARHPGVPPRLLDIEITESAALYDIGHVAGELTRLRELGVSVSLDDFGTGYSSLTYLRRLPMDHLKLDQSFVHGMMTDSGDLAIVQGVIGLARSFGYRIVAEGVETVEQGQMLLQMGCTLAQGYCIARPMPASEFAGWASSWQAPAAWQRARLV